ncbi:MAG: SDR family oxidoreductase [Clostridiales bacterium]|nr:SDR family oxidoreductase [Clostridiales bacterium]
MKVLFIGGTGVISKAISKRLLLAGHELWLINRGNRLEGLPEGAHLIRADINEEEKVAGLLGDETFDVVADFIAFVPEQLKRDHRLFAGRTRQFIYISSASAYQKPLSDFRIDEGTPLANPYWQYSRDKISGEELLMRYYREEGFPVTIVRPSHTYNEEKIPVCVHGSNGSWQVIKRMIEGKPVIIPGDGSSLWTVTWNDDFAKGFIGLMGNVHAIGEAVQITGDEVLTWNQIHRVIADALGVEFKPYYVASDFLISCAPKEWDLRGNLRGDKSNTVFFDNTKLKRLVPDFVQTVRFDQGVRLALDYIRMHPESQVPDPEYDAWCDRVIEVQEEALAKMNV